MSSKRLEVTAYLIVVALVIFNVSMFAQTRSESPTVILLRNVRIFDGKSTTLSAPANVLVRGNKIERISTGPIAVASGARVIDGGGRTLMPGLIDVHWHAMLIRVTPAESFGDVG